MGRPLFSHQSATTVPTVRVEPEHIPQQYEKWDYMNPFDPDSDEFFANAELETPVNVLPGDAGRDVSPVSVDLESGSSSDSSSSGSASPTQDMQDRDAFTPERLEARLRWDGHPESAYTYRATADRAPRIRPTPLPSFPSTPPPSIPATRPLPFYIDVPIPTRSPSPDYTERDELLPVYGSAIPIPAPPATPPPSTPSMSVQMLDPSPPPTVTPRLYTWSGARAGAAAPPGSPTPAPAVPRLHPGFMPAPPHLWAPRYSSYTHTAASSPPAGSPLPNLGARMSVAHIAPSITSGRIRV